MAQPATQPATAPVLAKELTIGQLAQRSGVATSALRFYEEQGLISSRRTTGNQRRYPRHTLRRVAFIRVSQNVGMPLSAIRAALARLPEERTPTREDWAEVSAFWRADLDARIRQLLRLRNDLTDCIGCGCLSLDRCALVNPGDVCGKEGCGPRRLLADEPLAAAGPGEGGCATASGAGCASAAGPDRTACGTAAPGTAANGDGPGTGLGEGGDGGTPGESGQGGGERSGTVHRAGARRRQGEPGKQRTPGAAERACAPGCAPA